MSMWGEGARCGESRLRRDRGWRVMDVGQRSAANDTAGCQLVPHGSQIGPDLDKQIFERGSCVAVEVSALIGNVSEVLHLRHELDFTLFEHGRINVLVDTHDGVLPSGGAD